MKWYGMNRKITPIWADAGLCEKQTNARLRVDGELQRRNGFASSNVAKQSSAVLALVPIGAASGAGVVVAPSDGSIQGYVAPLPSWADVALTPPIGQVVPGGCSLGQTMTHTFTYSNQAVFDTFSLGAFTFGTACCYQCTYTVVSNLTLHSGVSSLVSTKISYNGLSMQGLESCHGVTNTLYATGATYGGQVVGLVSTTSITKFSVNSQSGYWFAGAFPLVFSVTEDVSNGQTYDGTIAITFSVVPNSSCVGC